jgi:hypothetical protein
MPLRPQSVRQRAKALRLPFIWDVVKGVKNPDLHQG